MTLTIIDHTNRPLYLFGDLHGDFRLLLNMFKQNHMRQPSRNQHKLSTEPIKNSVFLICGDCGFGFNKKQYYINELSKIQKVLELDNNILLFLRGNHDDPETFKTIDGGFEFENIKFVPDYSILKTKENNTLCIGGAVSCDRSWRIKEETRKNRFKTNNLKRLWWKDEPVVKNEKLIEQLRDADEKVDSIVTHTIPQNYSNIPKQVLFDKDWCEVDKTLAKDIKQEGKLLSELFDSLTKSGNIIKWWCHGHLHQPNLFPKAGLLIIGLSELHYWTGNPSVFDSIRRGYVSIETINEYIKDKNEKIRGKGNNSLSSEEIVYFTPFAYENIEINHDYIQLNDDGIVE